MKNTHVRYLTGCGIVMLRKSGKTSKLYYHWICKRVWVTIPYEFYEECVYMHQTKTIGKIIEKRVGIPSDDFHQFYNKDGLSRVQIMKNLVMKLVKSWKYHS